MAEKSSSPFSATDCEQLTARGITHEEALRQLALLREPPPAARLVRACTLNDGIDAVGDEADAMAAWSEAAEAGRLTKFVPASGAATRMFQDLIAAAEGPPVTLQDLEPGPARVFLQRAHEFPFARALDSALAAQGTGLEAALAASDVRSVLRALLDEPGLGLRQRPKGLVPFHESDGRAWTALEEQLFEAMDTVRDAESCCRVHFTVSPEHEAAFRAVCDEFDAARTDVTFRVSFSHQKPATDTLALDGTGKPSRDADGQLLFRPGGHGALIENLDTLDADIVLIKNIDNVVPAALRPEIVRYKQLLCGIFVSLQRQVHDACDRLRNGRGLDQARACAQRFQPGPDLAEATAAELYEILHRPLRVCGMVQNLGEPGGGPFWTRGEDGSETRQIVESAQIDTEDAEQAKIRAAATHFNPVDLVCGLQDHRGDRFSLARYIDEQASFVAEKSKDGRLLRALERPGLWNGAMAGWNTLFVEIPASTFAPVKTILDLLRPAHRPRRTREREP